MLDNPMVAVHHTPNMTYPARPPFGPPELFPEYPFAAELDESNAVYRAVRETLGLLRLDHAGANSTGWNPLGEVIRPGVTERIGDPRELTGRVVGVVDPLLELGRGHGRRLGTRGERWQWC